MKSPSCQGQNCVEVRLAGRNWMMLGHVAAEVVNKLFSSLLRRLHIPHGMYCELGAYF